MFAYRLRYAARNAHGPYYIIICVLSGSTTFFPTLPRKSTIFRKVLLNIKCVLWFSPKILSETVQILTRIRPNTINIPWYSCKIPWYSCKIPVILVSCSSKLNYLYRYSKTTQMRNFKPICAMVAELFHVERQTDMRKLIIAFRKFTNAPKEKLLRKIGFYDPLSLSYGPFHFG